jgi:hypothetical protein
MPLHSRECPSFVVDSIRSLMTAFLRRTVPAFDDLLSVLPRDDCRGPLS